MSHVCYVRVLSYQRRKNGNFHRANIQKSSRSKQYVIYVKLSRRKMKNIQTKYTFQRQSHKLWWCQFSTDTCLRKRIIQIFRCISYLKNYGRFLYMLSCSFDKSLRIAVEKVPPQLVFCLKIEKNTKKQTRTQMESERSKIGFMLHYDTTMDLKCCIRLTQ